MKLLVTLSMLMLTGCATSVPVTVKFPDPPGSATMSACAELIKLKENSVLSDISRTVVQNYTSYHECSAKVDAWIDWYRSQKNIFERAAK